MTFTEKKIAFNNLNLSYDKTVNCDDLNLTFSGKRRNKFFSLKLETFIIEI